MIPINAIDNNVTTLLSLFKDDYYSNKTIFVKFEHT